MQNCFQKITYSHDSAWFQPRSCSTDRNLYDSDKVMQLYSDWILSMNELEVNKDLSLMKVHLTIEWLKSLEIQKNVQKFLESYLQSEIPRHFDHTEK